MRRWLEQLASPADGPLFGFRGPSAPYWEFRGERPSVALIAADRGPQLLRRHDDGSTWVRFGWFGDDVWLLCEDAHAIRTMEATRRPSLAGKDLASALGFRPTYVLTTLSKPIDGHCYKSCTGLLAAGLNYLGSLPEASDSAIAQPKTTRRSPLWGLRPLKNVSTPSGIGPLEAT